jgi:carbamoyltransferase
VAPASGDAGIAVGAAILATRGNVHAENSQWALLGPDETDPILENRVSQPSEDFENDTSLVRWLAHELSQERIVGLFRGRMEFGPRALGSRSILCDPRPASMRDRLNARVKHREMFRPFAASIMYEHVNEWFEGSFESPHMDAVFIVKKAKRSQIPSVVHVDHSCRIQTVKKEQQPFFWQLLNEFKKKTGIPMLINTSFNDCEPIVCTTRDAISCFDACEMDLLVIGRRVFSRQTFRAASNAG